MQKYKFAVAAALAILAYGAAFPASAQTGRTGTDVYLGGAGDDLDASAPGAPFKGGVVVSAGDVDGGTSAGRSHHPGGVLVGLGDGSVRNSVGGGKTESIGIAKSQTANSGRLGSLNGLGSIGQLAAPPGAPPAQAANNLKQLGLAAHNYDASQSGGGGKGDGIADVIVGTGVGAPGGHVKSGAGTGGGPPVKVYIAPSDTATRAGAGPHVKVFDGNAGTAAGATKTMTMKGQTIKQN